jgi:hypothetical protein
MENIEISTTEPMVNDYTEFDFDDIQYNFPVERDNCKYIDMLNKNQDILTFDTPELIVHKIMRKDNSKRYMDLIISESHKPFFEFIASIDDNNMLNLYKNSRKWFRKNIPLNILDDFHNPILKIKESGNAIFRTILLDDKYDDLKKGDVALFTIKLDSVKLYRKEFSTQWVILDCDTENIDYEFGNNMEEYDSVNEYISDDESVVDNDSSGYQETLYDDSYRTEPIEPQHPVPDNTTVPVEQYVGNTEEYVDNTEQYVGNTEQYVNKKSTKISANSITNSFTSNSTKKSYKKKKIIYANKQKIWNT